MAGNAAGAASGSDIPTIVNGVFAKQRMGTRVTRAYAEGRLAGSGNHPGAEAGSDAYVAFAFGVTNVADPDYKLETAVP